MRRTHDIPNKGGLTGAQIRERFSLEGRTFADFARENNFSLSLVYSVLAGRGKGLRGRSHNIAVALGLKVGARTDVRNGKAAR
jgi:gp16 family phage-associated protein